MQLNVREVAKLLSVSEKTIYRWIRDGHIPAYRFQDQYRFSRTELLEWATARRIGIRPDIIHDTAEESTSPLRLADALTEGGIHYRICGRTREEVLRAAVDVMKFPEGADRATVLSLFHGPGGARLDRHRRRHRRPARAQPDRAAGRAAARLPLPARSAGRIRRPRRSAGPRPVLPGLPHGALAPAPAVAPGVLPARPRLPRRRAPTRRARGDPRGDAARGGHPRGSADAMTLLLVALGLLVAGGAAALLCRQSPRAANLLGAGSAAAACALGLVPAVTGLVGGGARLESAWPVPGGSLALAIDPLTAFFLLPLFGLCGLAAVYGAGYLSAAPGGRSPGPPWFHFSWLVAGMVVVVTARNAVLFLVAWEVMSLASYFLVTRDDEREDVREAGWTYLVATHFGNACLIALFALLGPRSLDFADFGPASHAGLLFVLALIGFGTKAGFVPLHVWLPEAHPAAPSHVSAVMSGVMIKMGIYGLLRTLTWLGPPPLWWGGLLIAAERLRASSPSCSPWPSATSSACWPTAAWRTPRSSPWASGSGWSGCTPARRASPSSASRARCCTSGPTRSARVCCSWARARCCTRPAPGRWTGSAVCRAACR
ncbi:MAG: helix-turn-helix domain-containing protein [bacterium]|nr:helix-turn-helix domain-containing protein [bacterium]